MKSKRGPRRITIIQGHPDREHTHLGHVLAAAYGEGARLAGHDVRFIQIADLDFPILRSAEDFERGTPSETIANCQSDLAWANHIVILYPLWLGDMPALLKAFLEQVFRPSFVSTSGKIGLFEKGPLTGKSARIVVTMGMPGFVYRVFFGAHSLKSLQRNILGFAGVRPIRTTLIGGVGEMKPHAVQRRAASMRRLGTRAG